MTSWQKKWELLENDLKNTLGVALSMPTEPIQPNGVLGKILEEHWQAYNEGRVSRRFSEPEVWQCLNAAVNLRNIWQGQRWRPDPYV